MTRIKQAGEKKLMLFSGRTYPDLAYEVARELRLHTAQIQGFFDGPVDHLHALPLLAEHVTRHVDTDRLTVWWPGGPA
uniref:hypothetical protein n=1 Tax=Nonomuraea bangladeshensis TaxID=404385 RepID=UPI003F49601F